MYEGGDGKIAKLFPTYLMSPANCETFTLETFVVDGILGIVDGYFKL